MELAERLIVAADYDPRIERHTTGAYRRVLELGTQLKGLGVTIKSNSMLRARGFPLIEELHDRGIRVMADLKLNDIPQTMEFDAAMLMEYQPEFLTVMCCAGVEGMRRVQAILPNTEVLGVTVLTTIGEEECQNIYGCSTEAGVIRFARMAQLAGLKGLVASPQEVPLLRRERIKLTLNTPGIRPEWTSIANDDQRRVMTIREAIEAGTDRMVIGRPITQAKNPREAAERTLEEIQAALAASARKGG